MKFLILISLLLISCSCFGQEFSKSWKDINYAGDKETYHMLDIYLPAVEKPLYPVVIVIYGSTWFGPTNFLVMASCGSQMAHNPENSPESSLIGSPIQENPDKVALANPMTYVDSNDPPFLIFHGDKDPLVPFCESEIFFRAQLEAKVPSQYFQVPGAQHGPGLFVGKYFTMMADFFKKQIAEK
jgi:pimeloyl-ACP methyl ester carboxylesterase